MTQIINKMNNMCKAEKKNVMGISDEIEYKHCNSKDGTKHYCCVVPDGGGKRQWEKGGYR